jgi:hypothetical protein
VLELALAGRIAGMQLVEHWIADIQEVVAGKPDSMEYFIMGPYAAIYRVQ